MTQAFLHALLAMAGILAMARQSLRVPTVTTLVPTLSCLLHSLLLLVLLILILPWGPFLREAFLHHIV